MRRQPLAQCRAPPTVGVLPRGSSHQPGLCASRLQASLPPPGFWGGVVCAWVPLRWDRPIWRKTPDLEKKMGLQRFLSKWSRAECTNGKRFENLWGIWANFSIVRQEENLRLREVDWDWKRRWGERQAGPLNRSTLASHIHALTNLKFHFFSKWLDLILPYSFKKQLVTTPLIQTNYQKFRQNIF
jgi:hypothetical protein